jgi:hypothetical protein
MANTFVPVAQFIEGQILTAGSLMQFPQLYAYENIATASYSSGTAYQNIGSVYVSGGFFGRNLFVQSSLAANNNTAGVLGAATRFFVSGPVGLGAGSEVATFSHTGDASRYLSANDFTVINSGAGWITASGCVVFYQAQFTRDVNYVNTVLAVWGRGKP